MSGAGGNSGRPTAAVVRDLLNYDPLTGELCWKVDTANRKRRAGDLAGSLSTSGYRQIGILGRTYTAHNLAWLITTGEWPEVEIDHINRDRADNRFANLRPCDKSQNAQNRSSDQVSGAYLFRGRWRARITANGVKFFLGDFDTKSDAMAAYRRAKAAMHPFAAVVHVTPGP